MNWYFIPPPHLLDIEGGGVGGDSMKLAEGGGGVIYNKSPGSKWSRGGVCGQRILDSRAQHQLCCICRKTQREMRGRSSTGRRRSRIGCSGISKGGGPPPGSVSLGSTSGFVITEEGYVVTNFHIVERAYDMKFGLE